MLCEPMSIVPMDQRTYPYPYLASQENHPQEYWQLQHTSRMGTPISMTRDPSFDGSNLSYSVSASPASATYDSFLPMQQTAGMETSRHPSPDGSNLGGSFCPSPASATFNQFPHMQQNILQSSAVHHYTPLSPPGQALPTPPGFAVSNNHLAPVSPCPHALPTPPEYIRDPSPYSPSPEQYAPLFPEANYDGGSITFESHPKKLYQTSERRRTQNRNAQKNFRQRQVNHTKTLEDLVNKLTKEREGLKVAYTSLQARHRKAMRTIELLMAQHDAEGEDEDGQPTKVDNGDIMRKLINEILHDEVLDSVSESAEADDTAAKEESED